jgi:hypothetical protein
VSARLTRRALLVAALAAPALARAIGDPPVGVGRLVLPGLKDPRPGALADLIAEVAENTSVDPRVDPEAVDPAGPALFDHPWVVLNGDSAFEPLSDEAVANLRLYLREGGFLFIDDASGVDDSAFDRSVRRAMARILPGSDLAPVGRDHAVYRSFFLVYSIEGRIRVKPHLEGIWQGDITPVLYCRNDLLGAIQTGPGGWAHEVAPGGRRQRTESRKLALNVALFALTGNYKRDVVHVDTLLQRMRRQGGYAE